MLKPTVSTGIDMPSEPTDQPSVTVKKSPLSPLNDPTERSAAICMCIKVSLVSVVPQDEKVAVV